MEKKASIAMIVLSKKVARKIKKTSKIILNKKI
jgi:hypothetical protein